LKNYFRRSVSAPVSCGRFRNSLGGYVSAWRPEKDCCSPISPDVIILSTRSFSENVSEVVIFQKASCWDGCEIMVGHSAISVSER
jgi:hypothetical protein